MTEPPIIHQASKADVLYYPTDAVLTSSLTPITTTPLINIAKDQLKSILNTRSFKEFHMNI